MTQDTARPAVPPPATQGQILDDRAMDILFRDARTYYAWQDKDVSDVLLRALYDLMKWAPTASNGNPVRVKFVKSAAAKEKLRPCLMEGNIEKTMTAPVTAIIAHDLDFFEKFAFLSPHNPDAGKWFEGKPDMAAEVAMRNGSLQGAYLILAARALGLDCGPMSGFFPKRTKDAFFPDDNVKVNFLCNIGYGDAASLFPRLPRFDFDEICEIV